MLRFVLQRSGHETDEAEDGTEGLRKAVSGTYDAAEAHDMLGRVADRVTQCAARVLRTLPEEATLFVNVHPGELSDAAAVRLRYVQLQPWAQRVVLEITERS